MYVFSGSGEIMLVLPRFLIVGMMQVINSLILAIFHQTNR